MVYDKREEFKRIDDTMLRDIRIKFEQLHDRIEDQDTGRDAGFGTYERAEG